jgi:hypothetical protein
MMPARSSSFSRFDSSVGDIRGTPRRRSLNCVELLSNSRSTSGVDLEQTIYASMATGQNCP